MKQLGNLSLWKALSSYIKFNMSSTAAQPQAFSLLPNFDWDTTDVKSERDWKKVKERLIQDWSSKRNTLPALHCTSGSLFISWFSGQTHSALVQCFLLTAGGSQTLNLYPSIPFISIWYRLILASCFQLPNRFCTIKNTSPIKHDCKKNSTGNNYFFTALCIISQKGSFPLWFRKLYI